MKPIFCVWQDATNLTGWAELEEAQALAPSEIRTLGFLVGEDTTKIIVTHSYCPEDSQNSCAIAIPRGWITELRYLPADIFE